MQAPVTRGNAQRLPAGGASSPQPGSGRNQENRNARRRPVGEVVQARGRPAEIGVSSRICGRSSNPPYSASCRRRGRASPKRRTIEREQPRRLRNSRQGSRSRRGRRRAHPAFPDPARRFAKQPVAHRRTPSVFSPAATALHVIGEALLRHEDGNANDLQEDSRQDRTARRTNAAQDQPRPLRNKRPAIDQTPLRRRSPSVQLGSIEHPVDAGDRVSEQHDGVRQPHPERIWIPTILSSKRARTSTRRLWSSRHDV